MANETRARIDNGTRTQVRLPLRNVLWRNHATFTSELDFLDKTAIKIGKTHGTRP